MSLFKQSLTRWLLSIPRTFFPVLTLGSRTFIFRYGDVEEVLRRDRDFSLAAVNYEPIARHIGPFILGMDDGPEYQRDVAMLRKAVHREDGTRIREFIRAATRRAVADLGPEFDMVKDYTRLIPWELQAEYFGVPGPDRETMWRWNRTLFRDIFLDLKGDPEIRAQAEESAREMMPYLMGLIGEAKAVMGVGGRLRDTYLHRLLGLQLSAEEFMTDAWIAGNVSGVYMGGLEPANKAVCNILGQLLGRPEVLEKAREAARTDDVDGMQAIAWEAMRFHPNAPLLMRHCAEEQFIGGGGRKRRRIRGGKTLFVMTQAAMFDGEAFPAPKDFVAGRSLDKYLYFGLGLHQCFGNYINWITIPEMLVAILREADLRPVPGRAGKIRHAGPFPDTWRWQRG